MFRLYICLDKGQLRINQQFQEYLCIANALFEPMLTKPCDTIFGHIHTGGRQKI